MPGRAQKIQEGNVLTPDTEAGTTRAGAASADTNNSVGSSVRGARGTLELLIPSRRRLSIMIRWEMVPVIGAFLATTACLLAAGTVGFPEDDGWIHQDFARTLATTGRFAFQPGGSGAGSTSPLWVLLLVPIHLATHGHTPAWLAVGWTALLSSCALAGLGVLSGIAAATVARRNGVSPRVACSVAGLTGLAVVGEWHLVWAAVSGMETDLFALLSMLLIMLASRGVRPIWLGLLAGATIATRPEGALVVLLVALASVWQTIRRGPEISDRTRGGPPRVWTVATAARLVAWLRCWMLPFSAGALVCVLPYLALNLVANGHPLPSTFYAKQAELPPVGQALENLRGYVVQIGVVLVAANPVLLGLAILCISGWLYRLVFSGRRASAGMRGGKEHRRPSQGHVAQAGLSPSTWHASPVAATSASQAADFPLVTLLWLWPLVLAVSFGTRLPGAWQYGRYLMPILPPLLSLGVAGLASQVSNARRFLILAGGVVGLAAVLSVFIARQVYATDIRAINDYHVAAALWLRTHAPAGAVVATHDIGAIGYFSDHPVIDFAGLANPELIPLMGDQAAIEAYLRRHHVAYVVMNPGWFQPPIMARRLAGHEVYQACGLGACFTVYRTDW
jgi:hypothetical protein